MIARGFPRRATSRTILALAAAGLSLALAASGRAADHITIGTVHSQGGATVFVADAKGYFKAEGLDVKLHFFDSAAPIAVAAASGDIDFASTALTAAFVNLAAKGTLRVIASGGWERPGFQTIGFLVSNQAYAGGLHSFKDMKGRSAGITQRGTPLEYDLARVLKKYGIGLKDIKVVPLQSNQNVASALKGGEVDTGVQTVANIQPLVARGDAKLLGWFADEVGSGQSTVTFTTGQMAKDHPDTVRRFLRAFAKASATWDSAFLDAKGERKDQANAAEMVGIVAKYLSEKPEVVARGIGYFDPENRIVVSDMQDVLDWYRANGMTKTDIKADQLIDKRFAKLVK